MNDDINDFETLLQNNNGTCNHHRNIQTLMIEIFKIKKEFAPPIMENMFERRSTNYNLRNFQEFLTERKRTVNYGLETLSYRAPQLWSILPENIKQIDSIDSFKKRIKDWICKDCPCRLCTPYLQNIGFL